MTQITRELDQTLLIGSSLAVSPTDVSRRAVRLLVKGRHVGGPHDGETFTRVHELSKDGTLDLGPLVKIVVVKLFDDAVRLGVIAPPTLPIRRKETGR
jgi:sRNA-binding carbon storage regulator CsrA